MNRLQQRKLTRQETNSNPNTTQGLVHSSPTEPSGRASRRGTSGRGASGRGTSGRGTSGRGTSGRGTSGRGTSGRGTSGRGTSGRGTFGRGTCGRGTSVRGTSGRLSPPADSPSSYCSTSTSEEFLAASAARRVGVAVRGFRCVICPKNSSPRRV
jgi:hypothetical protein